MLRSGISVLLLFLCSACASSLPSAHSEMQQRSVFVRAGSPALAPRHQVLYYTPPNCNQCQLFGIAVGSNGNIWFAAYDGTLDSLAPDGTTYTTFQFPGHQFTEIISGADGNLWLTASGNGSGASVISKVTPSGQLTDYSIPSSSSFPTGLQKDGTGLMWFADQYNDSIDSVTTSGQITVYPLPKFRFGDTVFPFAVGVGVNNMIWFTLNRQNSTGAYQYVGTLSAGRATLRRLPTGTGLARYIVLGPDQNMWIGRDHAIDRVTSAYHISEYPVPSGHDVYDIAAGPDGWIWLSDMDKYIGRFQYTRPKSQYLFPISGLPHRMVIDASGNAWFDMFAQVGEFIP